MLKMNCLKAHRFEKGTANKCVGTYRQQNPI